MGRLTADIPKPFLIKKLHSLTGLFLVLFLCEHLLTNSQAALWLGDDGKGFVRMVNAIQDLPFLLVIEVLLLGVPFVVHGWWGIIYARRAHLNSRSSDGTQPALENYRENQAFSWQRITSWVLLLGVVLHVLHMRVFEYPSSIKTEEGRVYMVRVYDDPGIASLAKRLSVTLLPAEDAGPWKESIEKRPLKEGEVMAVANNFGTVELLVVRDAFKSPSLMLLYTVFVLAATFHAFNGLWTAAISWGVTLTRRSQILFRVATNGLMFIVAFLGLAAIWGTYWMNLKN